MAFGIDDTLTTAAAGIKLADTVVKTVEAYRKKGKSLDIERLIEEVRITALERIDAADLALVQYERMLIEKNVDLNKTVADIIQSTSFFHPFESHRLNRCMQSFNALIDATYGACDDVAALVRCQQQTSEMGNAIVESAKHKRELTSQLNNAKSIKAAIDLLRDELLRQKKSLS